MAAVGQPRFPPSLPTLPPLQKAAPSHGGGGVRGRNTKFVLGLILPPKMMILQRGQTSSDTYWGMLCKYPRKMRVHGVRSCACSTLRGGYHRVTKVAKNANTRKRVEHCINYNSTHPTPPHQAPWCCNLEMLFWPTIEKLKYSQLLNKKRAATKARVPCSISRYS